MGRNSLLGAWGEALAADFLRKKHYKLLATRYLCRYGEIDLIVCDKKYLVFVEVKLRRSAKFAEAREFVDYRKQERIRTTASFYLAEHETALQPRFDVIEIYAPEGMDTQKPVINHLEGAFQ